jgi:hypothetical protein
MKTIIRVISRSDGVATVADGQFVKHYDPTLNRGVYTLVTSADSSDARVFETLTAAVEYYRAICPNEPVREDGEPNRPITVFTVSFEHAP